VRGGSWFDYGDALVSIYRRETLGDDDVQQVVGILERAGAYDYCQSMARRHLDEALAELSSTAITPAAYCELREVADFLLEREFRRPCGS
jgi:geranylgeranyl pyrophosphate synthase